MNEKEFTCVIDGYIPSLNQNALKFTKNLNDADDLVQDTLLKAVRFYESYEAGTNMKGWLFVIMKNTFLNNIRKEAHKKRFVTQDDEISSANLLYSANRNHAIINFVMHDINKVMATLPEAYRVPFVLYVEGYKYQEIAKRFNIPIGTVKTRIHEARVLLRIYLKIYRER